MSNAHKQQCTIAVIGAGISGLVVANKLLAHQESLGYDLDLTMFEKARGVSGRTSTRRAEPYHFDHGAPFFTAHSEQFQAFLQPLIEADIVSDWQARIIEVSDTTRQQRYQWQANSRFVGIPKMNAIAKHLAQGITVRLATRVETINPVNNDSQWQLMSETGEDLGIFDWVICTAPAQQTHDLIPRCLQGYEQIKQQHMVGCYNLMLGFETPLDLDFDVALIKDSPLSCITVNAHKPKRPDPNTAYTLSILSSNIWAEEHLEADQQWVTEQILSTAHAITGVDLSQAVHSGLHRWRFANTNDYVYNDRANTGFVLDSDNRFAIAGDWIIKGSVENAFLSGDALADAMIDILQV